MPKVTTLDQLFLEEIRDLYDAEKQLTKALPKMAKAATSEDLRSAFEEHLAQTQEQVQRLEQVFELIGEKARGKKCAAMAGLIEESTEIQKDTANTPVGDAALIAAAQKVEHYEISSYGSARTHAEILGNDEAAQLLETTLQEEKQTDEKLTELAKTVNLEGVDEEDMEDMDSEEEEPMQAAAPSRGGTKSKGKTQSAGGSRRA